MKAALDYIKADEARTLAEQRVVVGIAAPPQGEQLRAQDYVRRLAEVAVGKPRIDSEGNQPLAALVSAALEADSQNSFAANRLLAIEDGQLRRVMRPPAGAPGAPGR